MIGDYIYLFILGGIQIVGLIALVVWLYKDGGILHILKFIVAVALICVVAFYITR